jgi:alpha-ribazole phosphatase
MKHYFMRHPEVSTGGRCIGQTDLSLSEAGKASMAGLIEIIRGVAPDVIVSSDLRRCRELAEAAAFDLSCSFVIDARWREIDFGGWENRSWEEIWESDRVQFERWSLDFERVSPPRGESFPDLLKRITLAAAALPQGKTALVVTHAGCLRALACLTKTISSNRMFDWAVPYGSLFALDMENPSMVRQVLERTALPALT